jgi:tRNA threonylcarbamoyladenosine biosynthesis protein TsaE
LYRLKSAEEVLQLGWDDYCDQTGIMLVEWADLFPQLLPESLLVVKIDYEPLGRKISLFQATDRDKFFE